MLEKLRGHNNSVLDKIKKDEQLALDRAKKVKKNNVTTNGQNHVTLNS
jgi:hypothetical protein